MDSIQALAEGLPAADPRAAAGDDAEAPPSPSTSYPPAPPPCASPRATPTVRQRNFTAQTLDTALHLQVLDLGRQYYVWVSAVGPKLGALHLAIKTPSDAMPAVASLTPYGTGAGGEAPAMAQRLALKLGKPVMCACNLPPNSPLLQVRNFGATLKNTRPTPSTKAEDKPEGQHIRALQSLSNGVDVPYEETLRNVVHEGSRMPKLPPRQTQKHPGYIRNESGGFFTSSSREGRLLQLRGRRASMYAIAL
ncbi:hypothetical protein TSOC_008005 [Tetrabaena socialis]|uniref:Uncharacterized protein n=1 Tax=Tetrabaena socialis TaxID=47790 RepID=A0A2J7ZZL1_9CHLO|nr:hypothetical protein TSOC_008005 [Tetrabaena socialis]|eukprot:PNH05703.1 hypothetical protein TSOC_008005 [Tetrabaena socialis]